ncbi:hypothetical protein MXD81_14795, partial [Microbacteriaceae bacterium K1510]|nr:hypothetical protein [Microbacteriaceae bacterium K1510]
IYSHLSAQTVLLGITVGSVSLAGLLQAMRWGWEPFLAPWFGKISDRRNRRQPFFIGALLLAAIFAAAIPGNLSVEWWLCMIIGLQVTATMLTTLIDALAAEAAPVPSKILFMSV